jgi:alanine dehydrogenase
MAVGLGAKVSILDVNVARLDYLSDVFGNEITTPEGVVMTIEAK